MLSNSVETLDDILDAWRTVARESDKRALWRSLARGGWFQACRDAVQRQGCSLLEAWLNMEDTEKQAIVSYNGPDTARMALTHFRCGIAASGEPKAQQFDPLSGFCRDLTLALAGTPLRTAEQETSQTVLLVDTTRNEGVVAVLTLELIPSGVGDFYPVHELAFLRDADFQQAEANASATVKATGLWLPDRDVRWRLQRRDGKPITALAGPSMGAAFALGISRLCAE
jgi:hypothetical protein